MSIPISELRERFLAEGFVIIPGALESRWITTVFSDIGILLDEALASLQLEPQSIQSIDEKYLLLKKASPKLKAHAYDLIKYLDSIHLSVRTGPLIQVLKGLANGPLLIDRVQVRIDDDSDDRALPLHQEVYGQISWECLNAWVPLVPVTPRSGALRIVPGSHKLGSLPHRFYPEMSNAHGIVEGKVDTNTLISPMMEAGDAVVFHPLLVHGSGSNLDGTIRWTLVARYNPVRRVPYLENPTNPLYIEQQDNTRIDN